MTALPLLIIIDAMLLWLLSDCIRDRLVDAPTGSFTWLATTLAASIGFTAISVLVGSFITSAWKSRGSERALVINENGIYLPYASSIIAYSDVINYYTEDYNTKYGWYIAVYIILKKRRIKLDNPFGIRKVMLLARGLYDTDDINLCMNALDYFVPARA